MVARRDIVKKEYSALTKVARKENVLLTEKAIDKPKNRWLLKDYEDALEGLRGMEKSDNEFYAKVYGYCRISTSKQVLQRQVDNIKRHNVDAIVVQEEFSGSTQDRPKWIKLLQRVNSGDTIVFDSVSRMARNSEKGVDQYMELFDKGVNLEFIKEPHINTEIYRRRIEDSNIPTTDNKVVDAILDGVKEALLLLAKEQVKIAFDQAEKERKDNNQRTKEALAIRQAQGVVLGRKKGTTVKTKKGQECLEKLKKHHKDFGGNMGSGEFMETFGYNKRTLLKYKKQLLEEL